MSIFHNAVLPPSTLAPRFLVLGSFVQAYCWMVDRLPSAGESLTAHGLHIEPGGKGLDVAIGIARLAARARVEIVLGVGRDAAADAVRQLLVNEGVNTRYVYSLAEQSGYGSGHIARGGQNAIAVFPGPNKLLTAHHADLACASAVAADVIYAQFETSQALILRTFELAKQGGKEPSPLTVLNPSPWHCLTSELLAWVDVLLVNEVEAVELLHLSHPLAGLGLAAAADVIAAGLSKLWAMWPSCANRQLVVTLGAQGCVYFSSDGDSLLANGFAVNAIDTAGCGDAFASAFCVAQAHGKSLAQTLREANACGAIAASTSGLISALPDRDALMRFLDSDSGA